MKKWVFILSAFLITTLNGSEAQIGIVNFKTCVEKSKAGKKEIENFETLKSQMERTFQEKEGTLDSLSKKLNDPDYLDSLSPEKEAELKHEFRTLSQDLARQQSQF